MKAYKGFDADLTARFGKGRFQFKQGETYIEEASKTGRNGFHCCENPFECFAYYNPTNKDRFFVVEAAGDINENQRGHIACTEITLGEELSMIGLLQCGMQYLIEFPLREDWRQGRSFCKVDGKVATSQRDAIVIGRGQAPRVKGVEGTLYGIILEPEVGIIKTARAGRITKAQSEKWLTVTPEGEVIEDDNQNN